MSQDTNLLTNSVQEAPASGKAPNLFQPEVQVIILTWVTFFLLLAILKKYAWGPILSALENREKTIRRSIEEAEKTHAEYLKIDDARKQILDAAKNEANETIVRARKTAQVAAKNIEQKAREEAQITLDNTEKEIKAQLEKAEAQLKQESIDLAIQLAGKLIQENLDEKKNKALIDRLLPKM